jgi:hypothetical protein
VWEVLAFAEVGPAVRCGCCGLDCGLDSSFSAWLRRVWKSSQNLGTIFRTQVVAEADVQDNDVLANRE